MDFESAPESRGSGHLFSVADLGLDGILSILRRAEELRTRGIPADSLSRRILGLLILAPSTRTRLGFHAAISRLGGTAISLTETKLDRAMERAESLIDTVRSIGFYCDALVIRHPSTTEVAQAISASCVPVINGGSGCEHHPTQALVDLFAIQRSFARLAGLRIGIVGDLAGSRAARSLVQAIRHFPPAELRLISPKGRELPKDLSDPFCKDSLTEYRHLALEALDVVYMAGLPRGRGADRLDWAIRRRFRLTRSAAEQLTPGAIILDPMPRIDEIEGAVDDLTAAKYFDQSREALFVRSAVLERVLAPVCF